MGEAARPLPKVDFHSGFFPRLVLENTAIQSTGETLGQMREAVNIWGVEAFAAITVIRRQYGEQYSVKDIATVLTMVGRDQKEGLNARYIFAQYHELVIYAGAGEEVTDEVKAMAMQAFQMQDLGRTIAAHDTFVKTASKQESISRDDASAALLSLDNKKFYEVANGVPGSSEEAAEQLGEAYSPALKAMEGSALAYDAISHQQIEMVMRESYNIDLKDINLSRFTAELARLDAELRALVAKLELMLKEMEGEYVRMMNLLLSQLRQMNDEMAAMTKDDSGRLPLLGMKLVFARLAIPA